MGLLVLFLACLIANTLITVFWWEREQWVPFIIALAGVAFSLIGTFQLMVLGG